MYKRLPRFEGGWHRIRLGKHLKFLKTASNPRADLNSDAPIAYLHYGDIHTNNKVLLDTKNNLMPGISYNRVQKVDRLQKGDLVLVDASEDLEGVGKSVEITTVKENGVVAGLHTIGIRFNKEILADGFKAYLQYCPEFQNTLKKLSAGTKVLATNRQHIASVEINLPDINEQTAIATALSDVDALIDSLDRLIAKKRDIKQATMQELLTGRKRLPGFEGEWETKRLGDFAKLLNGYAFKSEMYSESGIYPIVTIANVQEGRMDLSECNMIDELPSDLQQHQRLKVGDIIISMTGNVGRVCRVKQMGCLLNQRVGLIESHSVSKEYLYQRLNSTSFLIAMTGEAKGGAQGNLSKSDILSYWILLPQNIEEQKAIASVLSDMDAEIEALERRQEKTKQIKQGMMQELLTGRTRLVDSNTLEAEEEA